MPIQNDPTTTTRPATRVNVDRLRSELEYITAHPELWDQSRWIVKTECGTAGCLAGNTVLHESQNVSLVWDLTPGQRPELGDGPHSVRLGEITISIDGVADVAQSILGLRWNQADELFAPTNTLRDLWRIASEITNGAIQIPADLPGGAA